MADREPCDALIVVAVDDVHARQIIADDGLPFLIGQYALAGLDGERAVPHALPAMLSFGVVLASHVGRERIVLAFPDAVASVEPAAYPCIRRRWLAIHVKRGKHVAARAHEIGEGLVRDAGRLREYGVRIGGTGWVPEIPAVESSQERVRGILEESEGEDTAMLLFGAVTRGQWFSDGNKRTALMVANHQLIHDGIGVFSIPPEDKAQFVSMLLRYYETGDYSRLSDWLSQNAVGHVPGGLTLAQSSGIVEKTNDAVNGMGIVPGVPLDGLDGGSGLLR